MKAISQNLNNVSAVYCIKNLITDKVYIGSTSNLYVRMLKHRSLLRHNKHANCNLQSDWNKFGESKFDYFILCECPKQILKSKEDFYIRTTVNCYNLALGAIHYTFTQDTRNRMSSGRRAGFANGTITPYQKTPVYKYDMEGNCVAKYSSIKEASVQEKTHESSIIRCLKGQTTQNKGFRWSYSYTKNIGKYTVPKQVKPNKYIYAVSDGTSTLEFDGGKACADYFHVTRSVIDDVVKTKRLYRKKYMITKICRSHE